MKQRLLVSSILMGLAASLAVGQALAQNQSPAQSDSDQDQNKDKKRETTELKGVIVTGSLIPSAQIETASPTVTISAADIARQGFATVYDALKAIPLANGGVQGNQSSGGFTQAAQTISLFGLPPNYTLILINGKRLSNYPLAYNGSNSFTDLANIPTAMVDHIDIVPGGNSAIYGSDAIAGVVNIVLKQKIDGVNLDYRVGGYTDGGGQNQRVQISGGSSWGKLDASFALELLNQQPIFASQRSTTNSLAADPSLNGKPPVAARSFLVVNEDTGLYQDPGAATCGPLSYLYNNTTSYSYRAGHGYYCGTTGQFQATSLLNENRSGSAYTNLVYHINDTTEAYSTILFSSSAPKYNIGGSFQFWQSNEAPGSSGIFFNQNSGNYELWQHLIAPEEYGGATGAGAETIYTRNLNATFGLRGSIGSDWTYDAYYLRSQTNTDDVYRHFVKSAVDNYYLGPQLGVDPNYGYPVYAPNYKTLYTPLTPGVFNSLTAMIHNPSVAWTQNLNLQITNSSLFTLPAGDVGIAGILQAGTDSLHNAIPELIATGQLLGLTGSEAAGHRSNYAIGAEVRVPVTSMLTADVSGRYDEYRFSGNSAGKFTYKAGLELRPIDTLLLRANYATAFRAPDLVNLFGNNGFYTGATDYYLCRKGGFGPGTYNQCPQYNVEIFGDNGSSKDLQNVTAKTFTYGFVWSPIERFNFKVDYQRAEISNEVAQLSIDQLLQDEADCLLGQTVGGAPIDGNSPSCKLYESLIGRAPANALKNPNQLQTVTTYPINVSNESESGLIANMDYHFDIGRYGDLAVSATYYVEFHHLIQQFPGDPLINVYHDARYSDWKSTFNGSLTWNIGNFSTTVFGQRYGSIPNYAQTGRLPPWMLYNGSVKYNFDDNAAVMVTVNNIFNTKPPVDHTNSAFPYYNTYNYNPYGRAVWAEMSFHFGGSKK